MTDSAVKISLAERNIILNPAINWKYRNGGDFLIIPEADYDKVIHTIVDDHPNLTTEQKAILHNNFSDVIAVTVGEDAEGDPTYTPYTGVTFQEFDVLYAGSTLKDGRQVSGVWALISDNTQRFKVIEIPRMFDRNGERQMMYLFGVGYTFPTNGISPAIEDFKQVIEAV